MRIFLCAMFLSACAFAAPLDLHEAVSAGDKAAVVRLLNKGASVFQRDEAGRTALHLAVHKGDAALVECLLAGGADPVAVSRTWETPMGIALLAGRKDLVAIIENARSDGFADDKLRRKHGITLPGPMPLPESVQALFTQCEQWRVEELARTKKAFEAALADTSLPSAQRHQKAAALNAQAERLAKPGMFHIAALDLKSLKAGQVGALAAPVTVTQIGEDWAVMTCGDVTFLMLNAKVDGLTTGQVIKRWLTAMQVVGTKDIAEEGQPQKTVWVLNRFHYRRYLDRRRDFLRLDQDD